MTAQIQPEPHPRINLKRLVTVLLLSGVVPLSLLIALDIVVGWLPLLTIVGLLIFVPLGSFLVVRTALEEFTRIIDDAAPAEPEDKDDESDEAVGATGGEQKTTSV